MTPCIRYLRNNRSRCFSIALLAVVLGGLAAPAVARAADPVEDLKRVLKVSLIASDEEHRKFRTESLKKAVAALGIADLRRALMLQEWRDTETEDLQVRAIDSKFRAEVMTRLVDALREELGKDATRQLAAIAQVREMGVSIRGTGATGRAALASFLAPDLVKLLQASDARVREASARALGAINPNPQLAATALGGALAADQSTAMRRAAADGLASLVRVVIPLTKRPTAGTVAVSRSEAAATARAVSPVAGKGLADRDGEVRRSCLDALHQSALLLGEQVFETTRQDFPPPGRKWTEAERAAIKKQQELVNDERADLVPLAEALGGQAGAISLALVNDADTANRLLAAQALDRMGWARQRLLRRAAAVPRAEALPGTDSATQEPDPLQPGMLQALPSLVKALADRHADIRLTCVEALENYGKEADKYAADIARAMEDTDVFVRWAAARVTGRLAPADSAGPVRLLGRLLADADLDVRRAAADALQRFGAAAAAPAVPALIGALSQGDAEGRIAAIQTMAAMGATGQPAIPALTDGLASADPRVRKAAAEALGQFGAAAQSAVPRLRETLNDSNDEVRKAASDALLAILRQK